MVPEPRGTIPLSRVIIVIMIGSLMRFGLRVGWGGLLLVWGIKGGGG